MTHHVVYIQEEANIYLHTYFQVIGSVVYLEMVVSAHSGWNPPPK